MKHKPETKSERNNKMSNHLPKAEVQMQNGRGVLVVDGCTIGPMAWTASFRVTTEHARRLALTGMQVYFLWTDCGWYYKSHWQEVQAEAERVLAANPDAYIILRTACHPAPEWLDENPEELEAFEDGRTDHFKDAFVTYGEDDRMVCLASRKYAEKAGQHLTELIDFVQSSSFGHRAIGYFLVGGGTGEWYYPLSYDLDKYCHGFSPAFKKFYSSWLYKKYGTEKKLRQVWCNDQASIDDPHIPLRKEQFFTSFELPHEGRLFKTCDWGNLLDPDKNQCLADYYEARTAGTAATIEYLCKVVKEKTEGRALAGAFWGGFGCTYYHCNSVSGPMFLTTSPYVDFLSGPSNYEDRVPGGGATFRAATDSLHYRGKLWYNESDSRTHHGQYDNLVCFGGTFTLQDSIDTLQRDFAQVLCDDVQAFWFDQADPKAEHSYYVNDPDILALLKRQQELAREYYDTGRGKVSEIAVVYDQDSLWYVDQETSKDLTWYNRTLTFPRIGAPCDHILQDDLQLDVLPDYKMYIFVNCFYLSNSEREQITKVVKRDGKTAVWVYAPGLLNPDADQRMNLANMLDLTGITFAAEDGPAEATFRVFDTGHQLTSGLSPHLLYGRFERPLLNFFDWKRGEIQIVHPSLSAPLFYPNDPETTTLGRFITNDQPAYAVKNFDNWNSVYFGPKALNPPVMRAIANAAGVHIYLDTNDIVYANRLFIAVHATTEDTKRISLPTTAAEITDAYTNETIAYNTNEIEIKMRNGETRTFRIK